MPQRPTLAPLDRRPAPALLAVALLVLTLATSVATAAPAADKPAARDGAPRITLYATSWCGYCRKTRELLKELDAAYVEKDIEKSAEGREEYLAKGKGYRGVPLLDIGGTIVRGYSAKEIRRLVAALDEDGGAPAAPGGEAE